jgi:hypothetical protein
VPLIRHRLSHIVYNTFFSRYAFTPLRQYFTNFTNQTVAMPDFTLNTFHKLLTTLKEQGYTFQTFAGFLKDPAPRTIILRHDVDARKMNSLHTARMEKELGITGTYYFRMVPQSFDEKVIKQIAGMGHEIGYHYEDLSSMAQRRKGAKVQRHESTVKAFDSNNHSHITNGPHDRKTARPQDKVLPEEDLLEMSIASFSENLAKLRRVVPIETICMHGSPLSKYDNRMLWEKYDYRDFGIIGEPYFDINFEEVLYLTDTGRRWDGDSVSIWDKATGDRRQASGGEVIRVEEHRTPRTARRTPFLHFHSTLDIITAAKSGTLPDKIMLTVHPQRWDNRPLPWIKEIVWQNIKNIGKRWVVTSQRL